MEQLRAVQRRQASRARHQQHSSDQRSRWLASHGHHGAGRVGHCAAAQAISTVTEATLRAASRHGPAARAICGAALLERRISCRREQMNPSAGYRWLAFALSLALFAASLMLWRATDA